VSTLLHSEVEDELRGSVRALLTDRAPWTAVLALGDADRPSDPKLWRTLAADLGCAGLAVPQERGGAGASWRETSVVIEELGRAVAPVPFLGSAVIATAVLLGCEAGDLLGELAAGTRTAALAVPLSVAPGVGHRATVRADGGRLTGRVTSVADALPADTLLVPADDGIYAVHAAAAGVTRTPVVSLDRTRPLCDVTFERTHGVRLAAGRPASQALHSGLTAGAAMLASEQLGVGSWCLDTTVAYVNTRYQFGRPIGSFQSLKHRLADLWVDLIQARAVARYAAVCLAEDDPDAPVATALAQAHCSTFAVAAAEECLQMHGGIGFTWEHPAHLYLKRAKSSAIALGTADHHRAVLGRLVDLSPPVPSGTGS
jgi:alkylation response protein AidB-like acyl-CoA dehydrogenase